MNLTNGQTGANISLCIKALSSLTSITVGSKRLLLLLYLLPYKTLELPWLLLYSSKSMAY